MDIISIIIDELESITEHAMNTTLVDNTFFVFLSKKLIAKIDIKNEQNGKHIQGNVVEDFLAHYDISWPEICGRIFRAIRKKLPEDKYRVDHDPYSYKIDYYISKFEDDEKKKRIK